MERVKKERERGMARPSRIVITCKGAHNSLPSFA